MAEIGDLIPKSGIYTEPGVVTKKNQDGTVQISTEPLDVHKFHRYTNTTGLSYEEKEHFNKILDEIYAHDADIERVNSIQKEIDRLKTDPQAHKIVQYLRNQQSHLIRENGQLPKSYQWDEAQLKT